MCHLGRGQPVADVDDRVAAERGSDVHLEGGDPVLEHGRHRCAGRQPSAAQRVGQPRPPLKQFGVGPRLVPADQRRPLPEPLASSRQQITNGVVLARSPAGPLARTASGKLQKQAIRSQLATAAVS